MEKILFNRLCEVVRFAFVGGIATIIQYIIYLALNSFFGTNLAFSISYGISFLFNFILSNYFTFKTKPSARKGIRFLLAHGINYVMQISLLNIVLYMNVKDAIAPIIVYAITIPINYLLVGKALKL